MSDNDQLQRVSQALLRQDGWENLFTQLGIKNSDSRVHGEFKRRALKLSDEELLALFESNWAIERFCTAPAEDMVKAWYEVEVAKDDDKAEDDIEEKLESEHKRLNCKVLFQDALMWARVFGGAALLIGADDGQELDQPLNVNAIKAVRYLHLFDRRYVKPHEWEDDPNSPAFGYPRSYLIMPPWGGSQTVWHHSRVLRFEGRQVTQDRRRELQSWGLSCIESVYDTERNYGLVLDGAASAGQAFVQGVLKIKDLALLLSGKREDEILARFLAFKMGLSMSGLAMIDADAEEYTRMGTPITGLPELLDRMQLERSGALRMPQSRLYGNQQGKLAGATEDTKTWDAFIEGLQERHVTPPLHYLTKLLFLAKEGPFGAEPDNWKLEACELSPRDEAAETDMGYKQAQTADIYYKAGALEPSEMRTGIEGFKLNKDISKKIEEADLAAANTPANPTKPPVPPQPSNPAGAPGPQPANPEPGQPQPQP